MGKIEIRAEVDGELVAQAKAAGVGFDAAAEMGLRLALADIGNGSLGLAASHLRMKADPLAADDRARRWAEQNADAIQVHNARVAERGLFGDDLRRW